MSIREKLKRNALLSVLTAASLSPVQVVGSTINPSTKENITQNIQPDKGAERNQLCRVVTKQGIKSRRIYDFNDISKKYNLSDDFFDTTYTTQKGKILLAIIEYESKIEGSIEDALHFKNLSENLEINIDSIATQLQQKNRSFGDIFNDISKDKSLDKEAKEFFKLLKNSSNKGLYFADAVDKVIYQNYENLNINKTNTLSSEMFMKILKDKSR